MRQSCTRPKWFDDRDYSYLRNLTVAGWYYEITRLYKLSVCHNLRLHRWHPNIVVVRKEDGDIDIGHIGGPIASFVTNISAPDAIIRIQFERWLTEVRKQIKPFVATPGQYAINSKFSETKFGVWQSVGIVPFAELLAWRSTLDPLEKKRCKKIDLGEWIGRKTSKDVNTTQRILKEALMSLPALGGQVEHEMILDQGEAARTAIAEGIKTDIAR